MKQMFIVTEESGGIVAASLQSRGDQNGLTHITPQGGQKMYLMPVPDELTDFNNFADGTAFHDAITKHFHTKHASAVLVTPATHPFCFRFKSGTS